MREVGLRPSVSWLQWVWLVPGLIGVSGCGAGDAARGVEYRPSDALERLQHRAVAVDLGGMVRDFTVSGDTVYLLGRTGGVDRLVRTGANWATAGRVGRPGGGPGEFQNASGIAVTGSGALMVMEAARLQIFSPDGTLQSSFRTELPCTMMAPGVAAVDGGVLVHGNCISRGSVTDTVKAVLAWSTDTVTFRTVADEVRFTRDGAVGTMFAAATALTAGDDGTHLFGTGVSNCVTAVVAGAAGPVSTRRQCGLVPTMYSAPPPPELERRLSLAAGLSASARWPDPLPVYLGRVRVDSETLLVRPFAADSVVLEAAEPSARAVAVAPLDGFVGCRAGGCLWVLENTEPMRLVLVTAADLAMLLEATP